MECGDGVVDASISETCDDDNKVSGDGCSEICIIEDYYECTGEPSACESTIACPNGVTEPGETCDDNNSITCDGCDDSCIIEDYYECTGDPSI